MFNSIVCRYNEIATKGNNRAMFENKLIDNMRHQCRHVDQISIQRLRGRIFIHKKERLPFTDSEIEEISKGLSHTFGLDSFSPAMECEPDMDAIKKMVELTAPDMFQKYRNGKAVVPFRFRAKRSDKSFPLDSKGVEIELTTFLDSLIGAEGIKINLSNPDISIGVEIRETNALVYYETFKAPGGLPVGTNAPVLALLSGGIDSPVACNMAMKRGCRVDYLTFHSYPYTPMESLEKVKRMTVLVNRYQKKGILYACNLSEIQKLIRDHCNPKYRTVLYRRMMMRIASMLCRTHKLEAIVTGEAVGQVASQTIANLTVINAASDFLILRPLCGMDKLETIHRAEEIGTFQTSIEPMTDSCTVFAPDSPILAAKLENVEFEEAKIPDLDEMLQKTYNSIEWFADLTE